MLKDAVPQSQAVITAPDGRSVRRDLFAPTAGVPQASTRGQTLLPQIPSADGPPLPPLPPATPLPPPVLGSALAQAPTSAPPLPRLAAIVLGPNPQAVLRGDRTYTIVREGELTPWGTVAAIRTSGVVLTGPASQTISWPTGGSR